MTIDSLDLHTPILLPFRNVYCIQRISTLLPIHLNLQLFYIILHTGWRLPEKKDYDRICLIYWLIRTFGKCLNFPKLDDNIIWAILFCILDVQITLHSWWVQHNLITKIRLHFLGFMCFYIISSNLLWAW